METVNGHWRKSLAFVIYKAHYSSTFIMSIVSFDFSIFTRQLHHKQCFVFSVNKRLDEWVPERLLDTRKVQFPRKDGTTTGHNTGVTTPKKLVQNSSGPFAANSSRPTSPKSEIDSELVNGNTVMAAALQKKMNRKRKVSSICI